MTNTRTIDDLLGQVPMIDERNEQQLVIALFAIVVAWLALFVVTVAYCSDSNASNLLNRGNCWSSASRRGVGVLEIDH